MIVRRAMPLARSVPMIARCDAIMRPSSTNVANAAAPRNIKGNANDSSPNPLTSSWSAALEGCSALVITSSAPALRIAALAGSVASAALSGGMYASAWAWTVSGASPATSGSGANTTPKSLGRTNTSWRLLAGQMYSGEKAMPRTWSCCQPEAPRISIGSPGTSWKWSAMCFSTRMPLGTDGSSRRPSRTRTLSTGASLPSAGSPIARPSSW